MALTSNNLFQLEGQNPYMATLGEMGDISNLCQFGWYEWVYFRHCVFEGETKHADRAEIYIGLMKRGVGKDMREMNSPMRLWCFA